ncbi:MAG: tetraacyldisaccharide 4'-kinase [Deltaproteobacteria bacterium]|nr:tetraacyldisaccharide 4'-kinase [Deltaproteobacteria bacterium]
MNELTIRAAWERKGVKGKLLWLLLVPASLLYRVGVQLRNFCFAHRLLGSVRLPRPVVSVGNLTVGGTGKTPTCLWLSHELNRRGLTVGILSRGYRRGEKKPLIMRVDDNNVASLEQAGDEPFMMARIYGQTVGVGADRIESATEMLRGHDDIDVFVLDDGFQHRRVRRDVDLLLLGQDASGSLLPAGPFREPKSNLRRADFLLATGGNGSWNSAIPKELAGAAFKASLRGVSLIGFSREGSRQFPLTLLYRSKILTVTGIADPRGLYSQIHEWEGEIVETLEFPDHHSYTARDWQQISRMGRLVDLIITTEKDILKLTPFPFARDKLLALRVALEVENGDALVDGIVEKINAARVSER